MTDSDALPESAVKKATNLVRDADMAIIVGLLPFLGLIYILRLVQWHLLKSRYPVLTSNASGEHAELSKAFCSARPRLWFAVLLWPGVILFSTIYLAVT